jgi:hypothetical protein
MTPLQRAVVAEHERGSYPAAIGRKLALGRGYVRNTLVRFGLSPHAAPAFTRNHVATMRDTITNLCAQVEMLKARVAELERRKPAESPWPNASGFPDP